MDYPRAPREVVVELVKQLGDGVLLRFRTAIDAVNASLDTLEVLAKSPALPTGHAGVDTGPLVVRDGDIFGRTVNRASRLADAAGPNQLVVTAALADELPSGAVRSEPAGDVRLRGISDPVPLVTLIRAAGRPGAGFSPGSGPTTG